MDMSKLKKFVDFYEIYELVANGEETISGIRDALRLEKGLSGGNLQRGKTECDSGYKRRIAYHGN